MGIGSCYTTRALVEGSLQLLKEHLIGESALEPERVSEKLRQIMFWHGRGGSVEHAISGIDIALWDLMGKALQSAGFAAPRRQLSRPIKPYGSILFDEPDRSARKLKSARHAASRRSRWAGDPSAASAGSFDELLVKTARDTVGDGVELMVDAGGSEQFWPHGVELGREHGEDARRLRHHLVRRAAAARRLRRLRRADANSPVPSPAAKSSPAGNRFSR